MKRLRSAYSTCASSLPLQALILVVAAFAAAAVYRLVDGSWDGLPYAIVGSAGGLAAGLVSYQRRRRNTGPPNRRSRGDGSAAHRDPWDAAAGRVAVVTGVICAGFVSLIVFGLAFLVVVDVLDLSEGASNLVAMIYGGSLGVGFTWIVRRYA